jgi:hypothetical protein
MDRDSMNDSRGRQPRELTEAELDAVSGGFSVSSGGDRPTESFQWVDWPR